MASTGGAASAFTELRFPRAAMTATTLVKTKRTHSKAANAVPASAALQVVIWYPDGHQPRFAASAMKPANQKIMVTISTAATA